MSGMIRVKREGQNTVSAEERGKGVSIFGVFFGYGEGCSIMRLPSSAEALWVGLGFLGQVFFFLRFFS